MANDATNNETADGSGMRRRHSSQHEEVILPAADHDGVQTGTTTISQIAQRRASESAQGARSPRGASPSNAAMRRSTDQPRVRFSADVNRRPTWQMKYKNSDDVVPQRDGTSKVPDLSLDTSVVDTGKGVSGNNVGHSKESSNTPSGPLKSASSPMSPRGRNRGMSLRSSLFQKSMRDRSADGEHGIEMGNVGSSSQNPLSRTPTRREAGKKADATIVEVSPIGSDDYRPGPSGSYRADSVSKSGLRGVAALPNYQKWIQIRTSRNAGWRKVKIVYHRARKYVLRINEIPPSKNGRQIDLDPSRKTSLLDERIGKAFITNTIRSSRYTAWNFLPRQLFAQFSKLANFYFLIVSVLQMIPGLSTTGTYTTIIPLLFFVSISMAKEGYDDLRRYRLDKVENNREASVLHAYQPTAVSENLESGPSSTPGGPMHWAKTKWHNLQVGDVIKLERDEPAPADLVLLNSKGPNGIANIETMALDGETNLKSKQVAPSLAKQCETLEGIAACNAHFVLEDPNLDLYNFEGKVTYAESMAPLTNNEIIYRGSILRNTPEAIGMVIYSGEECKIRMNANKNPRIKAPSLQFIVNRIVIVIVIFVIALAIFNTVAYQIWRAETERWSWYISDASVAFFPILTSFIIMFNTMIPLSLYVSMEIVKLFQMMLLNDIDMYDEATDTPFEARTSTINEELGQISYIFSDKTGTLTDNIMKFRKLSVAGTAWLHDVDLKANEDQEELLVHKKRRQKGKGKGPLKSRISASHEFSQRHETDAPQESEPTAPWRASTSQWHSSARPEKAQPEISTREMIRYIQKKPLTIFAKKARMLLLSVALCHTCLPEKREDGTIDFQASSPDELALVKAAQELDYLVINRDARTLTIKSYPNGQDADALVEEYEVLDVIEFSSKRKRMSIVVRFPDQRICLICKGADSIIMSRLRLASLAHQQVVEIDKRVSRRKSLEAQEALRRKSEQVDALGISRNSLSRTSFSLGRRSFGGPGRLSTSSKLRPIRDEVDSWLNEREQDVTVPVEDPSAYYSPRSSMQPNGKKSFATSEARSSAQFDEDEDEEDLVDESLAIDEGAIVERCFQHINDFATEGLRTLLYGHRFLDPQEYQGWKKVYLDATTSLVDRQVLIERAGELIEQDLELGGATAIEDKLQNGVPEAIDKLRRANIKMWMLTGDKRETAINIGHSCRLIKDYSSVTILDHEVGQLEQHIAAALLEVQGGKVAHSVIVIDGQTLGLIEAEEALRKLFMDLAISADSVICCRASPSQKAGLVKAIRRRVQKSITLAIGDGANDIAMIQEAHVGIGITGKEGLQAARSSDYSIAQFRFLTKLLLVHGRWNYIRVCKYTLGTFWKEMMFYLVQALYQRYAGYTGTSLYESWSLSFFNTLFTSLCVIFLGIFEKDLLPSTLLAVPELYSKGQHNGGFNFKIYLGWTFMASAEAMIIFFTMWGLFGNAIMTDSDLFSMGDLAFTACIVLINTKLQVLESHNKSIMAAVAMTVSIGGWFFWNILLSLIYHNNVTYNVEKNFLDHFGRSPAWWLTLILILVSTLYFEIAVRSIKAAYWPTDVDTFQELEQDLSVRKRFEEASAVELQAGWHRGTKKSSIELAREAEAQAKREIEVEDLLNRPRVMEEGRGKGMSVEMEEHPVDNGIVRRSTDIHDLLSRRFGTVRTGTLLTQHDD